MKKKIGMAFIMIILLSINAFAADDLKSAFQEGTVKGQLRSFFFVRDFDVRNTREDFATGGVLYYRTAPLHGINIGLAFYTAQSMGLNDSDKDVYGLLASDANGNHESFSALGESYIQGTRCNTTLKLGRYEIETPWLNTDDNRLTPLSYEAYTLINNSIPDLEIFASHVTRIKGKTSTDFESMTRFAGIMTDDKPVTLGGLTYTGIEGLGLQLWDYYAHDYFNSIYFKADCSHRITDSITGFGAFHYLDQDAVGDRLGGNLDTRLLAVEAGIGTHGFTLGLAYADIGDNEISCPWGNDYIVTGQINDCARAGERGILAQLGYDFSEIGINGLKAKVVYIDFDTPETGINASPDMNETDFDVKYKFSGPLEGLGLRGRHAIIDQNEALGGEDFKDTRLYLTYDFSVEGK